MGPDWINEYFGDIPDTGKKEEPKPSSTPPPTPPPPKKSPEFEPKPTKKPPPPREPPKEPAPVVKKPSPPPQPKKPEPVDEPLPPEIPFEPEPKEKRSIRLGDDELEQRLASVLQKRDEVEEQIDKLYSQMGFSKKTLTDYLSNPQNFSETQWNYLSRYRKEMEDKIWGMLDEKGKKELKTKQEIKKGKAAKGKTIGGRKNWISMQ